MDKIHSHTFFPWLCFSAPMSLQTCAAKYFAQVHGGMSYQSDAILLKDNWEPPHPDIHAKWPPEHVNAFPPFSHQIPTFQPSKHKSFLYG